MPFPQNDEKKLRPRERLDRRGARCLSDAELLSVLLDAGVASKTTPDANAENVLSKVDGSFYQLSRWEISDFLSLGISWQRACNLVVAFEVGRRIEDRIEFSERLSSANEVFRFFERKALPLDREKCWTICTDAKFRVIRFDEITSGTASSSNFHPRDFLRPAVRANAVGLLLVHNHPSGDATPSADDIKTTRSLREACKILQISFIDHVIIGRKNIPPYVSGYYSFSESGVL